jgi:hypothetical protein
MKFVQIGTVDVDAGLVMIGDPCYSLPDDASRRSAVATNWARFCEAVDSAPHAEPLGAGVAIVVRTLHGDGEYPVMAELTSQGRIRRVILDLDPGDDRHDDWDVWADD